MMKPKRNTHSETLSRLASGEALDWGHLKRKLHTNGFTRSDVYAVFTPDSEYDHLTRVSVSTQEAAARMVEKCFPVNYGVDRIDATRAGDSHKRPTKGAMFHVIPAGEMSPLSVTCLEGAYESPFTLSKTLLVIENIELFLSIEITLDFIHKYCDPKFDMDQTDILWGSGNLIAKATNKFYLDQYESIQCLLDIDHGGLVIYSNLINLIEDSDRLEFVIPDNLEDLLLNSEKDLTEADRQKIAKKHKTITNINARLAMSLMYSTWKRLEEETYIDVR